MLSLLLGLILSISAFAQSTVNGHVKDATGEPVIGASILINGTTDGTVTDLDGNFILNVQPGATLTISYIGYQKQQVTAVDGMVVAASGRRCTAAERSGSNRLWSRQEERSHWFRTRYETRRKEQGCDCEPTGHAGRKGSRCERHFK